MSVDHGPESDFGALYVRSRERLAVQVYALTGNWTEATEVVQEAFARAWSRWDTVALYDDPEAWVRKVAFRAAVSRWRRVQRLLPLSARIDHPGQDDIIELRVDVRRALRRLAIRPRQAVVLHYLAGLPVEAVATQMGAPVGTVKSWLARSRRILAAELGTDLDAQVKQS